MRLRVALVGLLLLVACAAHCTDGRPRCVPAFPEPFGVGGNFVQLGWFDGAQAWYICTATNDIDFNICVGTRFRALVVPKLSSALVPKVPFGPIAAQPVYMVTNVQNGLVFSTTPGDLFYSALWQVFTVTWKPGITPRPITSALPASPGNPTGLPDATEADIVATDTVLDCPILALGPLTRRLDCPGNTTGYLIPQTDHVDPVHGLIYLPAWFVYCQDPVTTRPHQNLTQITDVSDPALAELLGANLAPGLLNLPDSDTSDFFVMRGPKPLNQFPVVSACPTFFGPRDCFSDYSPVMRYVILQRDLPPYTLVKTLENIRLLLLSGKLKVLGDSVRINASVIVAG